MIRRRGLGHEEEESSSSDEEDAFSALSKKGNAKKKAKTSAFSSNSTTTVSNTNSQNVKSNVANTASKPSPTASQLPSGAPIPITSSMKRHHKPSDARKAKMDALLQELEAEKERVPKKSKRFIPEKKGSFVTPGEEHLTTNLFVGNLAPSIAEEDLSNLFSQFGELYSVKIMWPRTMEERNRRRNTGFVCFMRRDDAEEAMEACDETDPFNNGRKIILRWGKSVKKIRREDPEKHSDQKRQRDGGDSNKTHKNPSAPAPASTKSTKHTEGAASNDPPIKSKRQASGMTNKSDITPAYDPNIHASRAIPVEIPSDKSRFHFISTTASYVARDPELEERLRDEEKGNPLFDFLNTFGDKDERENIFYRWRVYSFCQGDTYSIWRTEPFVMFPNGRYWLPPALDTDAVNREKANAAEKERRHRQQKEDRANRELMTGRQFERRKRRGEFGSNSSKLKPQELDRFDRLVRKKLSLSRKTICEAMSFCFDNCIAAKEVCGLLKEAMLDESDHVTNDIRIARLYLLSDILFNSQQPGVRNAFMYRTTIESMAVDFFREFGHVVRRKERLSGRISVNKIRKAVSSVLGAWTEWGVYNATFVDDLEAYFEGREVKKEVADDANAKKEKTEEEEESPQEAEDIVIHGQRGNWREVSDELSKTKTKEIKKATKLVIKSLSEAVQKKQSGNKNYKDPDESKNSADLDGEDLDGEDLDGEDLDGEDLDGADIDGEDLDGEDFDAEQLVENDLDGDKEI